MITENNKNLHSFLQQASIYNFAQNILGGTKARKKMIEKYLKFQSGEKILDMGCGAGNMLDLIDNKDIQYYGIDYNESYIEFAKNKFKDLGEFHCGKISDSTFSENTFDTVISIGVLHHLSDSECIQLVNEAAKSVNDKGRFVAFEPIWVENQNPIAKFILSNDRGKNIKNKEGYKKLLLETFKNVEINIDHDFFNIPYTIATIVCSN